MPIRLPSFLRWTSVGRWTVLGTLACVLAGVTFNLIAFRDLPMEAQFRGVVSAVVLPTLMALPMFLAVGNRLRHLSRVNRRLDLVARTDSLTACLNRGAFIGRVETALGEDDRPSRGAMLMIDADNFKTINDVYGHATGDEALMIIARSIRNVLRSGDLLGRMGGEEFAVFLPELDLAQAEHVAERVRRAVNLAVFEPDGRQYALSVSIGGAVFQGSARFSELFRIADQRLYGAKQRGRNQAVVVTTEDHPFIDLRKSA